MTTQNTVPATAAGESTLPNLVRLKTLCAGIEMSRPTIWRLKKAGFIPVALDLGPKLSRYDVAEVRKALSERAAEIRMAMENERTGFVPAKRGRPRKHPVAATTPNA